MNIKNGSNYMGGGPTYSVEEQKKISIPIYYNDNIENDTKKNGGGVREYGGR